MNEMIQQRLDTYQCNSEVEEEFAIKEITQEVVLWALSEAGFFSHAGFQGGTALRILHGLMRFSEDLDFALTEHSTDFSLQPFMEKVVELMTAYGFQIKITGKEKLNETVRKRFLKEDSVGQIVSLQHVKKFRKTVKIKIELDINPPNGATYESKFHDFPIDFSVKAFDRPSLFAGKNHALLCRSFIKGRDWYDFAWYIRQGTSINFDLLTTATNQQGPWEDQGLKIDLEWYLREMKRKIQSINWQQAKADVIRFVRPMELKSLDLWSERFFLSKLEKLKKICAQ